MSIPNFQTFLLPILQLLSDDREHEWTDIKERVASKLGLAAEDMRELTAGKSGTKYTNRMQWARSYMTRACLIETPRRGMLRITKRGLKLLKNNPKTLTREDLMQYPEFREFVGIQNPPPVPDPGNKTPDDLINEAESLLSSSLESELLKKVSEKSPAFFEHLVIKLLLAMGYGGSEEDILQTSGYSGDRGIDGIIKRDILGLDKVYIQAKKWSGKVSAPTIREFVGSLHQHGANTGIFITTSSFTQEAQKSAEGVGKTVVLIDGNKLVQLMVKHNVGVQVKETIQIKKIDEDFFLEED